MADAPEVAIVGNCGKNSIRRGLQCEGQPSTTYELKPGMPQVIVGCESVALFHGRSQFNVVELNSEVLIKQRDRITGKSKTLGAKLLAKLK